MHPVYRFPRLTEPLLGALKLSALKRIIIDASHIDQKKMGVLEIKDIMVSLARLLASPELRHRWQVTEGVDEVEETKDGKKADGRVQLLFY